MPTFEAIDHHPDRATALAALDELLEVFDEFPFGDEHGRSVALAMTLTGLMRQSFPAAPAFGISAKTMGEGKTYIGQVPALLALGRPAAVVAPPRDAKEESKLIFASALGGAPFLFLDNFERRVESDTLCAVTTSETYSDRVLSISKTASVSTAFTVIITGNGLVASGDMSARMLICNLNSRTDHPEHRRFKRNLTEWIPANRGRLVARALTFLRGYIASGETPEIEPWQRFPEWDRLIRAAIVWAELPDPLLALRAGERADPRRLEHEQIMGHWHLAFKSKPTPIRDAVKMANTLAMSAAEDHRFRDALLDVAGERGEINVKRLGHWLRKMAGRIQGGMQIVAGAPSRGSQTWSVEIVGPVAEAWDVGDARV
jgi:hypothetical protein